jgi:DNA repair exonuclease SbcCD ATPase subunit
MKAIRKILMLTAFISMANFGYSQNKNDVQTKSTQEYEQEIAKLKGQVSTLNSQIATLNQQLINENQEIQRRQNEAAQIRTELNTLQQEKAKFAKENTKLEEEATKLKEQLDAVSQYYPIIIKSIKVGNVDRIGNVETACGEKLYSSTSMYLTPQIEYIGLKQGQTITLYLKLYNDGNLSTSTTSPSGYSFERDISISNEGKERMRGWGDMSKGSWDAGNYRYEIWYEGTCLKTVDFILHSQ